MGHPLYLAFKFRAPDFATGAVLPSTALAWNSEFGIGFATFWKFVVVDCRSIASVSPVAVHPRSRWLLSVVASGGSTVVARWRPLRRFRFSASVFRLIRSDRCLAQRLGGNKRQTVSMHDCASRANVVWYKRCTVYLSLIWCLEISGTQRYVVIYPLSDVLSFIVK